MVQLKMKKINKNKILEKRIKIFKKVMSNNFI